MAVKESRPGPDGRSNSTFPVDWENRFGPPPAGTEARRAWINRCIEDGKERRTRGEVVSWLAPESERR